MIATKQMDHNAYQKRLQHVSDDCLRYTIADAKAAIKANPDNPNCTYYQDEICYAGMEMMRRQTAREYGDCIACGQRIRAGV